MTWLIEQSILSMTEAQSQNNEPAYCSQSTQNIIRWHTEITKKKTIQVIRKK